MWLFIQGYIYFPTGSNPEKYKERYVYWFTGLAVNPMVIGHRWFDSFPTYVSFNAI